MANENHLSQLAEMVVQAAKKKGLDFSEKSYCVICVTKDDTVLTVYRQPAVDISGLKPQPYFGNLFYPRRKYGRFKYIDAEFAEIIYKKLSEVLNKQIMEKIELTKEELLEFAKMATFRLDDRLQPFSREQLRAEAWVEGYLFARSHQPVAEQEPAPIDGLSGAGMILEERGRQIQELGYDDAHDRQHQHVDFVKAAMAYLILHADAENVSEKARGYWPFDPQYFKPRTLERDLVKAGALIAAAIDRLNQKED